MMKNELYHFVLILAAPGLIKKSVIDTKMMRLDQSQLLSPSVRFSLHCGDLGCHSSNLSCLVIIFLLASLLQLLPFLFNPHAVSR